MEQYSVALAWILLMGLPALAVGMALGMVVWNFFVVRTLQAQLRSRREELEQQQAATTKTVSAYQRDARRLAKWLLRDKKALAAANQELDQLRLEAQRRSLSQGLDELVAEVVETEPAVSVDEPLPFLTEEELAQLEMPLLPLEDDGPEEGSEETHS